MIKKLFFNPILLTSFLFLSCSFNNPGSCCISDTSACRCKLERKTDKTLQEGISFYNKKIYGMAEEKLLKVFSDEPSCVTANFMLGVINIRKNSYNLAEAEKYLSKVVELCPGYDPYTYFYLGEITYGREDWEKTITYLTEFLNYSDKVKNEEDLTRADNLLRYSRFISHIINNPVPFDPKVVEGISTSQNEYLPILSPDNQMAFFTREIKLQPDKNSLTREEKTKERFCVSTIDSTGKFGVGAEMEDPFNIENNEGGATLTADNKTLYYTVCKYDAARRYLNCDIYTSENAGGYWLPIHEAGASINSPDTWESQPSVSPDGRTLYFVSDRKGGFGGYDLYKSLRGDNGEWGMPVNLGPAINTKGNEKSPFIHPDGKTFYFSSDGQMGLGGYDIFFTRMKEDGSWEKPRNIGYPINSPEDEVGFFVSTDGTKGFFASNKYKGEGGWDLYSFDLYDAARPEKVLFIRGNIRSEFSAEPLRARIELKNMETKKISEIPMDTVTGNYVAIAPFNSDYIMTVKKTDHVYESKYIARADSQFTMPVKLDIEMKPIEVNKSYRINDIYFLFNSFDLQPGSMAILDQLIDFLNENPGIFIQIQGHTDNIGNDQSNLKLSESRAESVYKYLISGGIDMKRLTYKGYGESQPVASNETEEGRAKNRRTVFVITRK